jgi:hypothetical protein
MTSEVWLYGSNARGDGDASSDVDVLVAGECDIAPRDVGIPTANRLSMTRYSWPEIEQMAGYGSLFLHHIRLEGRPLLETEERRLATILDSLPPYKRAAQELDCFRQVLADVELALRGDHSPAFELSVVATAARHSAILGCYLIGEPDFGRTSAFRRLLPRLGYSPDFADEMEVLYAFRQAENESRPLDATVSSEDVREWVMRIRVILHQVEALAA